MTLIDVLPGSFFIRMHIKRTGAKKKENTLAARQQDGLHMVYIISG